MPGHSQAAIDVLETTKMPTTAFETLAELGERLEATSSRLEMADYIARFLRDLGPEEVPAAVRLLVGQILPEWDERSLNLSWRAVLKVATELSTASEAEWQQAFTQTVDAGEAVRWVLANRPRREPQAPRLTVPEVYATFENIANAQGKGSRTRKEALLRSLLTRATPLEAKYLVKDVLGEMRHGVSEGILLDSIARASKAKPSLVRRANMFLGDLGDVASLALREGEHGLGLISPRLFRPLKPMLAQPAQDLAEALQYHRGEVALEYKLDGARVQIHKDGSRVEVFTRNLSRVTRSLPEVVEETRSQVRAHQTIMEGEVIATDKEGRPLPFQHLMRRFRRVRDIEKTARQIPIQLHLFDILYLDGRNLVDLPYSDRWLILEQTKGEMQAAATVVPRDLSEAEAFAQQAQRAGHEGVMVKELRSPYRPGVRGKSWFKVKHTLSLDLAIVAADWGYGRRHGWLSNYHLAAWDEERNAFLEVGKTFKGLTDKEFQQMTDRLLALETHRKRGTVFVDPKVVVEVVFNEVQASTQYESGLALRFARITRVRDDKSPSETDTLQTLRKLFREQFQQKGRYGGTDSP
ncbi:MAG: ATP-dependent DNA ligase [Anaerolineae bacterium]|nr:ATP-dependent DNA ligase [Anaerolineae bacterium]